MLDIFPILNQRLEKSERCPVWYAFGERKNYLRKTVTRDSFLKAGIDPFFRNLGRKHPL